MSLRATAPSGFPRCRGLCPLGGACSPGGPVPLFGLGFGTLFITPLSTPIPREGMCPALGSALFHHKRLGHTVHWVHPKSCPSRARGPVGGGGCPLRVVAVVYGSFVATLVLARGCPAGGALRVEETSGHRHSDQDTGYVGGSGVGLSPVLSLGFSGRSFWLSVATKAQAGTRSPFPLFLSRGSPSSVSSTPCRPSLSPPLPPMSI